jgi:hypothetical protein
VIRSAIQLQSTAVAENGQELVMWRPIKDIFSQLFNDLRQQRVIPMFAEVE